MKQNANLFPTLSLPFDILFLFDSAFDNTEFSHSQVLSLFYLMVPELLLSIPTIITVKTLTIWQENYNFPIGLLPQPLYILTHPIHLSD